MSRPDPRSIADVVASASVFASLRKRMDASQARLACILPLVPAALRPLLKAASLDWVALEKKEVAVWHVLCPNAAAAAKLRQLQPRLLQHLHAEGLPTHELHFKIEEKMK